MLRDLAHLRRLEGRPIRNLDAVSATVPTQPYAHGHYATSHPFFTGRLPVLFTAACRRALARRSTGALAGRPCHAGRCPCPAPLVVAPRPHLDADRRADEPERLAQLVDQEPLVREVERRRDVGEEHERRRRHADLRRVEDAHVPSGPGSTGGCAAVIVSTNLFSSPASARACAAPRRPGRSSRAASASRSPVSAEMCRIGA